MGCDGAGARIRSKPQLETVKRERAGRAQRTRKRGLVNSESTRCLFSGAWSASGHDEGAGDGGNRSEQGEDADQHDTLADGVFFGCLAERREVAVASGTNGLRGSLGVDRVRQRIPVGNVCVGKYFS